MSEYNPMNTTDDGGKEWTAERVFAIYDKTGSGMNVGQLHTALLAVGRDISATDCADLLDEADTDGDGLLSKAEFVKYCEDTAEKTKKSFFRRKSTADNGTSSTVTAAREAAAREEAAMSMDADDIEMSNMDDDEEEDDVNNDDEEEDDVNNDDDEEEEEGMLNDGERRMTKEDSDKLEMVKRIEAAKKKKDKAETTRKDSTNAFNRINLKGAGKSVAVSPDSEFVAVNSKKSVKIFNIKTGSLKGTLKSDKLDTVRCLDWSGFEFKMGDEDWPGYDDIEETFIVAAGKNGKIVKWKLEESWEDDDDTLDEFGDYKWKFVGVEEEDVEFAGHDNVINCIAISDDRKYILTGSGDVDADTSKEKPTLMQSISAGDLNELLKEAEEVAPATPTKQKTDGDSPLSPMSPNTSKKLEDNSLRMWNAETGKQTCEPLRNHTGPVLCCRCGTQGGDLWVCTGSTDKKAQLYNVTGEEGELELYDGFDGSDESVGLHGDCNKDCCKKKTTVVKDDKLGTEETKALPEDEWKDLKKDDKQEAGYGSVTCVDFSPNGSLMITGSSDDHVRLYDTDTNKMVASFDLKADITALDFSPIDGTVLNFTAANKKGLVKVYGIIVSGDEEDYEKQYSCDEIFVYRRHTDTVASVRYSADGKQVVSASKDMTVRMLNIGALNKFAGAGFKLDFKNNASMEKSIITACSAVEIVKEAKEKNDEDEDEDDEDEDEDEEEEDENRRELNMLIAMQAREVNPDFDPDNLEHAKKLWGDELPRLLNAAWTVYSEGLGDAMEDTEEEKISDQVSAEIKTFIPDLLADRPNLLAELIQMCSEVQLEKLASTDIFQNLLEYSSRGGVLTIYYIEVIWWCIFMCSFVRMTFLMKFAADVDALSHDAGSMMCWTFTMILASYFFLREIAQVRGLYLLGQGGNWLKDPFNFLDVAASLGTILLLVNYFNIGPGDAYNHQASAVSLCCWMKTLGLVKAVNQSLATFVLMITSVINDIRAFMIVLVAVMFMFGHAFYLELAQLKNEEGGGLDFHDGGDPNPFGTMPMTIMSTYTMLLGDFDLDAYPSLYTKLLFVVFMFIVVIILLNILIAIVSDSYDNAMVKSTELFWKSRLELVAEIKTVFHVVLVWYNPKKVIMLLHHHLQSLDRWYYFLLGGVLLRSEIITQVKVATDDDYDDYSSDEDSDEEEEMEEKVKVVYVWYMPKGKNQWKLAVTILFSPFIALMVGFISVWRIVLVKISRPALEKLQKRDAKGVELSTEVSAGEGEWAGKVMDIVNRVNEHTNKINAAQRAEMQEQMRVMKNENVHLEAKLDVIMKNIEILMESQGKKAVKATKASSVFGLSGFGKKMKAKK